LNHCSSIFGSKGPDSPFKEFGVEVGDKPKSAPKERTIPKDIAQMLYCDKNKIVAFTSDSVYVQEAGKKSISIPIKLKKDEIDRIIYDYYSDYSPIQKRKAIKNQEKTKSALFGIAFNNHWNIEFIPIILPLSAKRLCKPVKLTYSKYKKYSIENMPTQIKNIVSHHFSLQDHPDFISSDKIAIEKLLSSILFEKFEKIISTSEQMKTIDNIFYNYGTRMTPVTKCKFNKLKISFYPSVESHYTKNNFVIKADINEASNVYQSDSNNLDFISGKINDYIIVKKNSHEAECQVYQIKHHDQNKKLFRLINYPSSHKAKFFPIMIQELQSYKFPWLEIDKKVYPRYNISLKPIPKLTFYCDNEEFMDISFNLSFDYEKKLLEFKFKPGNDITERIGKNIGNLVENRSTIHIGSGYLPNECLKYLTNKRDLGMHSHFITDNIISLIENTVLTCRKKNFHPEKIITSFALGTERLYEFIDKVFLFLKQNL
jgi:hypothetical protein